MLNKKKISLIIPVLNEADFIESLINHIQKNSSPKNIAEIIVVDGGSTDNTVEIARGCNAIVISSEKGRAKQMNAGAALANGAILYFLHADTYSPTDFDKIIINAVDEGISSGCFRMKFDSESLFLSFFAWFSRFNSKICRGGDQSLFITREAFEKVGKFNEDYFIYEDSEFVGRLYKNVSFKVLPYTVVTSARKYQSNGMFQLQFHFAMIHLKNYLGAKPEQLHKYYKEHIN